MDTKINIAANDTRVAEVAVVSFEGVEHAAYGFTLDLEAGRMIAYPSGRWPGDLWLTAWGGERICRLKRTGRSRAGFHGTALESFVTLEPVAGYYWHGRGLGVGMLLKLRRGRKASRS